MLKAAPEKSREKRAIVTISYGDRPWLRHAAQTVSRYASRCGADHHLEIEPPSPDELPLDLPDHPGRPMKLAYAAKSYIAWKYMAEKGYTRLLVLDDTCCVRATAPIIFDAAEPGICGFTATNPRHAERSFKDIRAFLSATGKEPIPYDPLRYASTSVMLYDSAVTAALAPDRILDGSRLLFSKYPHQTLSYFLLMSRNAKLKQISRQFQRIPALSVPGRMELTNAVPYIGDGGYIYHLTGGFKHRAELVAQISHHFMAEWDQLPA